MGKNSEIFNKFRAVTSAESLPPYESPATIAVDNMGTTDFLFELIKQTKGQEGLKNVVLKSTLSELNNNISVSNTIVNIIKDTFFCLFDIIIPEDFTEGHNGFFLDLNEIDPTNMLSIDPNSPEGKHIYDGNDANLNLNYLVYTAFNSSEGNPVIYSKNINGVNKTIFSIHYVSGNQMKLFFGSSYANKKLSEWAEDYLQDVSFFNMPNFTSRLIDIITGVVSIKTGKNYESIENDSKILQMMEKLFGYCKDNQDTNSDADNEINEYTEQTNSKPQISPNEYFKKREDINNITYDKLFDFTPDELLNIQNITDLRNKGRVRFSVCGNFEVPINPDDVFAKLDTIFSDAVKEKKVKYIKPDNTTGTTQAYDNLDVTPNMDSLSEYLGSIVGNNLENEIDKINETAGDETGSPSANDLTTNLPNMEAEFELGVIKAIPFALVQMVISPQLLLLIKSARKVMKEDDNDDVFTIESVMENLGKVITQIGDEIWNTVLKNVFNILKKDLLNIISGLATKYLSQRFTDYAGILSFLINLIKNLSLGGSGCSGMLDVILQLLSLNYFGPALPIPPPLVYAGGFLKPGLNQVSVVNDLKSQLTKQGIEVGAYMSDGTPNYLMSALETTTNTLVQHIKMDSKIDVMVNGVSGPAIGSAQIS